MNIFYPQFQSPLGYDNINDRRRYLHGQVYSIFHRHAPVALPLDPEFKAISFYVKDDATNASVLLDKVLLNGEESDAQITNGKVTVTVPFRQKFTLTLVKSGFQKFEKTFMMRAVINSTQRILPESMTVTFKAIDTAHKTPVNPEQLYVNGVEMPFGSTDGNVTVEVPYKTPFTLALSCQHYQDLIITTTSLKVNKSTVQMLPEVMTVTFTVEDIATGQKTSLDKILMNSVETSFTQTDGQVQISHPYTDSAFSFQFIKAGYAALNVSLSMMQLNNTVQKLSPDEVQASFIVKDGSTGNTVNVDKVMIDDDEAAISQAGGHVTLDVPYNTQFNITLVKAGYVDLSFSTTSQALNGSTKTILPISISVTFRVVDSKAGNGINPSKILVDGEETQFASTSGNVTMDVPYSRQFTLVIQKQGYVDFSRAFTSSTLNKSSHAMTPEQQDETESKVSWNHSAVKDLDSHMLIYNSAGTKLSEVYYSRKTYTDANVKVVLDRDDTGSNDGETITITPTDPNAIDYKFILVLYDYSNRQNHSSQKMSQSQATFTITINNVPQDVVIPENVPGVFWNVYEIQNRQINIINEVTTTNDYGITA